MFGERVRIKFSCLQSVNPLSHFWTTHYCVKRLTLFLIWSSFKRCGKANSIEKEKKDRKPPKKDVAKFILPSLMCWLDRGTKNQKMDDSHLILTQVGLLVFGSDAKKSFRWWPPPASLFSRTKRKKNPSASYLFNDGTTDEQWAVDEFVGRANGHASPSK